MSDEMRDYFMGLMQGSAITAPIISIILLLSGAR